MPFSIRPAEPSDADAIADVHVRGWRWGYRGLLPEELLAELDADERAERLRAVMTADEGTVAVHLAEIDSGVIGFVSSGPSRDTDAPEPEPTGEVYALYVEENAAGTGIGTALLRAAVDELRSRGFERATLWVLDTNVRARRFYKREGWLPDGETKTEDFRGFELREVRLERPLAE
jgi:ribosomal protein S18 acetylase RimI-like enzyme